MNYVMIAGHLGKDAETRHTTDGTKVTTLTLATNYRRGGKEEAIWWRATLWGDRWDKMLPYLTKGKPVIITGDIYKPEMYTDKNGQQQIGALEVRAETVRFSPFGRPDQANQGQGGLSQPAQVAAGQAAPTPEPAPMAADEDPLPF